MRRSRALAGHFNSSTQASESLAAVQTRGTNKKPLKVINDCPTRWWSTWKFAKRLRGLKNYIALLVAEGIIDEVMNLTREEWDMLEDIEELLEPFMAVQRYLEGQEYVTLSFVPYLISRVRKELEEKAIGARSQAVRDLANDMLTHRIKGFEMYWGTGEENSLFDENEQVGRGNRQKGFPRNTLLAAALDPRTKSLQGFGIMDKTKIWYEIKRMMTSIAIERSGDIVEVVVPLAVVDPDDIFFGIGDNTDNSVDDNPNEADIRINTELDIYRNMKGLSVKLSGDVFSDPLSWWQIHEKTLSYLITLARRLLCVPATSAPSERVISVAGLTISKCRTSVQSQHTSDLIFLHDSWKLAEECEAEHKRKL